MRLASQQTAVRLFPIDLLKALSIVAVVSFHSVFFHPSTYATTSDPIEHLFAPLRFCVPVLFTISFFLLKRGLENNSKQPAYPFVKKRLIRLLIPTIFWFSLALLFKKLLGQFPNRILFISLFQGWIFPGAYYLIVLLQFIPLFVWLHPWFERRRPVLLAFALQSIVFVSIYASISGVFGKWMPWILEITQRSFFVYWFIYMVLGAYLYNNWSKIVKISQRLSIEVKIFLLAATYLIMLIEYNFLRSLTGKNIIPYEYVMFSCVLSVIVGFICFASVEESQISQTLVKIIKLLATYSLGIFCINGIAMNIFVRCLAQFRDFTLNSYEFLAVKLLGWIFLLILSLGLSRLIDKLGFGTLVR